MRRTTWAAATTVLATTVATVLGQAALVPAHAAARTAWRPGDPAPAGTGFWSNACGSPETTAHGPAGLDEDTADVARTRSFVRPANGDVAWRFAPGTAQAGLPVTLPSPATTTALSVLARSATAKGVQARLLVFYQAPGASADSYFIGTASRQVGPSAATVDLSGGLLWLQHHGASLFQRAGWSPAFPTSPFAPSTNQPRSLHQFTQSADYRPGGPMLAGYELGCTGDAFTVDHLRVSDASGTTDLDLSAQRTTTALTSDHPLVRIGNAATLTGAVVGSATGSQVPGKVALEAAPYGSDTFTEVDRLAAPGPVFTVRPNGTTRYRLRYLGSAGADRSTSTPVTVEVSSVVSLRAASDRVRLGNRATLTGAVRPAAPGVPVTLQQQSGDRWVDLAHTSTDTGGAYRFTPRTTHGGPAVYRVVVGTHAGTLGVTSRRVSILVTVPTTVSAAVSTTTIRTGRTLRVTGASSSHLAGLAATLQRRVDGRWRSLARATTTDGGRYALAVTAGTPGSWTLRVRVAAHDPYLAGVSPRRTVTITPKPKPKPAPAPAPAPTPTPAPSPAPTPPPTSGGGTGIG